MLEHVNNLEGLKLLENELVVLAATQVLDKWNEFAAGTISREELSRAIDLIWTPEKNQLLINSTSDGKIVHFVNFVFNGIKTQVKDQHMPGTE